MRSLLIIALLLCSGAAYAQDFILNGGVSVPDGRQQPAVAADVTSDRWFGTAGALPDEESAWLGGGVLISLGEVDFSLGGLLVSKTTERISSGANFHLGLRYSVGTWLLSFRHISNGAQTFGHDTYPNSGENMLMLGFRF